MAHSFDTGLAVPQRTAIQRGACSILAPLLIKNGGYLKAVQPFGAIVRSYTDDMGVALIVSMLRGAPAIAVATGVLSMARTGIGGMQAKGDMELIVYHFSNHARDMQNGRMESDVVGSASDTADPGLHVAMEHARELLMGQRPAMGTSVKQIWMMREEELATLAQGTLWMQTFMLEVQQMTPSSGGSVEFRTAEQLLQSIGWRVTLDASVPSRPTSPGDAPVIDFDSNLEP